MSVPQLVASAESLPETRAKPALFRRRALVRRALVLADLAGLSAAFTITVSIFGLSAEGEHARPLFALGVFFLSLPAWALLASLHGLYGHDEGRMGHSTVDDFVGVVHLVTVGAWLFFIGCWITEISYPRPGKLIAFWLIATLLITACRAVARTLCQRSRAYVQNTVIVGGGDVGQLVSEIVGEAVLAGRRRGADRHRRSCGVRV